MEKEALGRKGKEKERKGRGGKGGGVRMTEEPE